VIKVKVDPSKPIDYFIRLFNRKVVSENILNDVNDRKFYIKPSQKRQMKLKERDRKIKQRNRQQMFS
jgi:ribosomal protein S21